MRISRVRLGEASAKDPSTGGQLPAELTDSMFEMSIADGCLFIRERSDHPLRGVTIIPMSGVRWVHGFENQQKKTEAANTAEPTQARSARKGSK